MKKLLLSLTITLGLCGSMLAQTTIPGTTNAPTIKGGLQIIQDAIALGNTNWLFEAHGLYAPKLQGKYGGGIGVFYPLSDYVVLGIRGDYVDGGFYMPSGNGALQLPITVPWIHAKLTPFGYVGLGIPLSGATVGDVTIPGHSHSLNGDPIAIYGVGAALRLWTSSSGNAFFDLVGDREHWSGFDGNQYRLGALFKISF